MGKTLTLPVPRLALGAAAAIHVATKTLGARLYVEDSRWDRAAAAAGCLFRLADPFGHHGVPPGYATDAWEVLA